MAKKHRFPRRLLISGATVTGILAFFNHMVEEHSADNEFLDPGLGQFYHWNNTNVFYRKEGSGDTPLLLIHSASVISSGHEFTSVIKGLSEKYTVYVLDLPGCGCSEKKPVTYTNFYFTSLISSFIKNVIGEKTVVAASGLSSSFAVMAAYSNKDLVEKLYLFNPPSNEQLSRIPNHYSGYLMSVISFPVIGKAVYNAMTNRVQVYRALETKYFKDPERIRSHTVGASYEAAHRGQSGGRYLMASLNGQYMNWNIRKALSKLTVPVTICCSTSVNGAQTAANGYKKYAPGVSIIKMEDTGLLPQLERPEEFISILLDE